MSCSVGASAACTYDSGVNANMDCDFQAACGKSVTSFTTRLDGSNPDRIQSYGVCTDFNSSFDYCCVHDESSGALVKTMNILGSAGDDTIKMWDENEIEFLTPGSAGMAVFVDARGGEDVILGSKENTKYSEILRGGSGDDTISGLGGDDEIHGDGDDDTLFGGHDDDVIYGGTGNDTMFGDGGDDTMFGGGSVDIMHGGLGDDTMNGDGGGDTMNGDDGDDIMKGGANTDSMNGGPGADTMWGMDGVDAMAGGMGNDKLLGGANNDIISGDEGVDTITGGSGDDVLNGGSGNDFFCESMYDVVLYDTFHGDAGVDSLQLISPDNTNTPDGSMSIQVIKDKFHGGRYWLDVWDGVTPPGPIGTGFAECTTLWALPTP